MTNASAFMKQVRDTLISTRAARKGLSHDQLALLTDAFQAAIADYKSRRAWFAGAKRDPALVFAEDVARQLKTLVQTILRRSRAIGTRGRGVIAISLEPSTQFTAFQAVPWLPVLRRMQAGASAEVEQWTRPYGRTRDDVRLLLECPVADALDRAGIRPTTSRDGAFARVLVEVIYPETDLSDRNAERAVRSALKALPEWRSLPPHRRRLPRATKATNRT